MWTCFKSESCWKSMISPLERNAGEDHKSLSRNNGVVSEPDIVSS